jgi:hypothetical protein
MEMMRSAIFRDLDSVVTKNQPINLIDSDSGETLYDSKTHTIRIPALDRGAQERAEKFLEGEGRYDGVDSLDEWDLGSYRTAAYALATEWNEWIRLPEAAVRAERIDADLGGGQIGAPTRRPFISRTRDIFAIKNIWTFSWSGNIR